MTAALDAAPAVRRAPTLTVLLPSFNEAGNVAEMVRRLDAALAPAGGRGGEDGDGHGEGHRPEVLYVDDSRDDTPERVREAAATARHVDVRVIHRDAPVGGLAGAVTTGLAAARGEVVVVMDADLQHPPESVPHLVAAMGSTARPDVVVASRYVPGGSCAGLDGLARTVVSRSSTALAKAFFPRRLRGCTDPMTGFFAVRTASVDLAALRPSGFKILLELLACRPMRLAEVPLVFGERFAGDSKASAARGLEYVAQLARLRWRGWAGTGLARLVGFGAIGALGTLANLAIFAGLLSVSVNYVVASVVAAELTIAGNFALQEATVFRSLAGSSAMGLGRRALGWVLVNNAELVVRTLALVGLVSVLGAAEVPAQAGLIAVAFAARYAISRRFLYRARDVPDPVPATQVLSAALQSLPEQQAAAELELDLTALEPTQERVGQRG